MAQTPSIPKGTRDYSPEIMVKRNYIFDTIKNVFRLYGYMPLETPAMENLSTLMGKYGDEGDKLLFKILNSGDFIGNVPESELLEKNSLKLTNKISEKGLRYDLTVPFARFVVQHQNELTFPFKRYQIQPVWRADRPQKGRYREFYQCDADVVGSDSLLHEVELIQIVDEVYQRLNINVRLLVNNRKILAGIAETIGYPEQLTDITVAIDKMDKIGMDGVKAELLENGFAPDIAERYLELYRGLEQAENGLDYLREKLGENLESSVTEGLREIIESVNAAKAADFRIVFDPTLVRGMSYYTGPIFEIVMPGLGISCGGGGRYDKMVGKFTGKDVPACGFSIGFERIILLLTESGFRIPNAPKRIAYLVEKGVEGQAMADVIAKAQAAREEGVQVLVARMNKNKKFQKEQLTAEGYEAFVEFYREALKNG